MFASMCNSRRQLCVTWLIVINTDLKTIFFIRRLFKLNRKSRNPRVTVPNSIMHQTLIQYRVRKFVTLINCYFLAPTPTYNPLPTPKINLRHYFFNFIFLLYPTFHPIPPKNRHFSKEIGPEWPYFSSI